MAKNVKLSLHIESANEAFQEDHMAELGRILIETGQRIANGGYTSRLRDANGNTVGTIAITREEI